MKNLSLNAKMIFVFLILITGNIVIAGIGAARMASINDMLSDIVKNEVPRMNLVADLRGAIRLMVVAQKNVVLQTTDEGVETFRKNIETQRADFAKDRESFLAMASEESKAAFQPVDAAFRHYVDADDRIYKLAKEHNSKDAAELSEADARQARLEMEDGVKKVVEISRKRMHQAAEQAAHDYENARNTIVVASLLAILLGVSVAFVVLRMVSRAIDLVIAQLNDNSAQVTSAAQQIASSSEELSQAATEQAASLQETSSAIEEMSSMTRRNADGARQSAQLSQTSSDSATRGKQVVDEMLRAMSEIDSANNRIVKQVDDSNQRMAEIVKVISEIGNKTKVINDIVFQTKLLSFNASVEAARAGEHGKGFAVVAEEVGNLAQMSGNAAKDISSMLESSIQRVESIAAETKTQVQVLIAEGKSRVESGTRVAQECGQVLDEIVGNVGSVTRMVGDIVSASDEQARGTEEITRAMGQLDQVTQQNAAVSEEAASAAEELSAQAEMLRGVVQTLIQTIKGASSAAASAAATPAAPALKKGPAVSHATTTAAKRPGNVIPLKTKKPAAPPAELAQRAVGSDVVPSENDPRFKDV